MRKAKKSRVDTVGINYLKGIHDLYYLVVPFDKKNRVIPSSVECAYNSRYYDEQTAINMLRAL